MLHDKRVYLLISTSIVSQSHTRVTQDVNQMMYLNVKAIGITGYFALAIYSFVKNKVVCKVTRKSATSSSCYFKCNSTLFLAEKYPRGDR